MGASALAASCGGSASSGGAGAALDADLCGADAPVADGALEAVADDAGSPFCGGSIELAGVTPFGPFAPDAISAFVDTTPANALDVTVARDPPAGPQLTFPVPADSTGSVLGAHDVVGFVESDRQVMPVMVYVDVTSVAALGALDGGVSPGDGVSVTVTATTACSSFSGTLVARTCGRR